MFGKKRKPGPPRLAVFDGGGEALYDGELTGFQLTDATVKALSLHFFNDPEPCEIHRSAVLSRVFTELEEALEPGATVEIGVSGVPWAYFSAYPDARRVRLTKG